jgi:hypothetical protein
VADLGAAPPVDESAWETAGRQLDLKVRLGSVNYRKLEIGSRDLGIYRARGPISWAIRNATPSCEEIYLYPRFR